MGLLHASKFFFRAPRSQPLPMAEEGEATRTDVAELVNMPETTRVRSVAYCPVSTLPFEYCEFDADYKASQAWFAENWRSAPDDLHIVRGATNMYMHNMWSVPGAGCKGQAVDSPTP